MEHATYASRLQYLDADDVDDSTIDFSGLEVRGPDDSKLGDIDGFIVDPENPIQHVSVNNLNVGRSPEEVLRILDGLQTDELCPCNRGVGGDTL